MLKEAASNHAVAMKSLLFSNVISKKEKYNTTTLRILNTFMNKDMLESVEQTAMEIYRVITST